MKTPAGVRYTADRVDHFGAGGRLQLTPSSNMPRALSRITGIRVERLREISEEDAWAEGARRQDWEYEDGECCETAREAFLLRWKHANGSATWNSNPWVWAISFERIAP